MNVCQGSETTELQMQRIGQTLGTAQPEPNQEERIRQTKSHTQAMTMPMMAE